MDIHEELALEHCPFCRGDGSLEEEGGWCWYVVCLDCGSATAPVEYDSPEERLDAARRAAHLWNVGKVVREDRCE